MKTAVRKKKAAKINVRKLAGSPEQAAAEFQKLVDMSERNLVATESVAAGLREIASVLTALLKSGAGMVAPEGKKAKGAKKRKGKR